MLLASSFDIEKTLNMKFTYDDGSNYAVKFGVGDVATITFNNNGKRDRITGRISRIEAGRHYENNPGKICQQTVIDSCDRKHWFIIVDGSSYNDSNMKRIEVHDILGVEVSKRDSTVDIIQSPLGDGNITDFRLCGGVLQLSTDHQKTWMNVLKIPTSPVIVDPDLQEIADKIAENIPSCVCPADREKFILSVLETMKETGQITIDKNCNCGCNEKPPVEDHPTCDCPTTDEVVDAVITALKNQGLINDKKDDTVTEEPGV